MGRNFSNPPTPAATSAAEPNEAEPKLQGFSLSIEMEAQKKRIVLFDVDGTLVKPMGVRHYDPEKARD
jgi:hypothetical protein